MSAKHVKPTAPTVREISAALAEHYGERPHIKPVKPETKQPEFVPTVFRSVRMGSARALVLHCLRRAAR